MVRRKGCEIRQNYIPVKIHQNMATKFNKIVDQIHRLSSNSFGLKSRSFLIKSCSELSSSCLVGWAEETVQSPLTLRFTSITIYKISVHNCSVDYSGRPYVLLRLRI